jgi:hypothetical protein
MGADDQVSVPASALALGPLALNTNDPTNSGTTETRALLGGSAAIDAALGVGCLPSDQRGVTRPAGNACDAGAYEAPEPNSVVAFAAALLTLNFLSRLRAQNRCGL